MKVTILNKANDEVLEVHKDLKPEGIDEEGMVVYVVRTDLPLDLIKAKVDVLPAKSSITVRYKDT